MLNITHPHKKQIPKDSPCHPSGVWGILPICDIVGLPFSIVESMPGPYRLSVSQP